MRINQQRVQQQHLSRRDFLKLASAASLFGLARSIASFAKSMDDKAAPNIILLVFDAWAAGHVPLYGYARNTMPNLGRFAEKALVYHHHYSAGTFTAPGAAALLTGLYPWNSRAFHIRSGISERHVDHQIFSALESTHTTLGYSQNKYADKFLYQFNHALDQHVRAGAFNLQHQSVYDLPIFRHDGQIAFASFDENIFHKVGDYDSSLIVGPILRAATVYKRSMLNANYQGEYPKGIPDSSELFLLEDVVNGAIRTLKNIDSPALLYMHFYPPHWPYQPKSEFLKVFRKDGLQSVIKETHPLSAENYQPDALWDFRAKYDSYLASWDDELGRLFDYLETSGLLENSYVFITSDHGEMFERGVSGHTTPLIFNPLIHIPLIVSCPNRTGQRNIYTNTSSTDLLPTFAHLAGHPRPDWADGELLPGLGGVERVDRSIYALDAKENSAFMPIKNYSIALTKGRFRLTYYNYRDFQEYELYNLEDDPEELNNLYPALPLIGSQMQQELTNTMIQANRPYEKTQR